MKKVLLPTVAILLAFIFSAFTNQQKQAGAKAVESSLYWYFIDEDENIVGEVDGPNLRTRTEVFTTVGCPGLSGDDCARGYNSQQTINLPAPAVSNPDEHIMKNN